MEDRHLEPLAPSEPQTAWTDTGRPTLTADIECETAKLHDLSSQGFRMDWPNKLLPGDVVWLKIPGLEAMSAKVTWALDHMIGCKFDVRLHPALFAQSLGKIASTGKSSTLN